MSDLTAKPHDSRDRNVLISAVIVFAGLCVVAAAIVYYDHAEIRELGGPLVAAGVFIFLGLAYFAMTRLAELHERADRQLADAMARADEASRWAAKAAEYRRQGLAPTSNHEQSGQIT